MWIYYLGCISLGGVAGLLVGMSSSPVVGVVLPLLFALLGGATGVIGLLPSHPNSERARTRFRIVGGAATAVSIPFLLASMYGILLRTGNGIETLLPRPEKAQMVTQTDIESLSVEEILDTYLLDSMLSKLGVSQTNKELVVRRFLDVRVTVISDYIGVRPQITNAAAKFSSLKSSPNSETFSKAFDWAYLSKRRFSSTIFRWMQS
ncbi:MAG: hypothetical protein GY807_04485 [Gammaproteobacteria bacterium]|nr:hypothetical protein [Gammaproteobacteria bacterium]